MFTLPVFRQAMMNWNRFATACILVAAALVKADVPIAAIVVGLATAAAVNWQLRPRAASASSLGAHTMPAQKLSSTRR